MKVSEETHALIHAMKAKTPPMADGAIAKELGLSRGTVFTWKNKPLDKKTQQILDKVKKNEGKVYKKVFEMIKDDRVVQIIDKIFTGINDQDVINKLLTTPKGVGVLNNVMGTLLDKARHYDELVFKKSVIELNTENEVDEGYNDNYILVMQKATDKIKKDKMDYLDPNSLPS